MKSYKIFLLGILLFAASSCSLREQPESFVSRDNFFNTANECRAALNSCYRPLKSIYQNSFLAMTEACNDLFSSSSTGKTDFTLAVSPAQPMFGASVWKYGYQGVMYCNECIEMIGRSKLDAKTKGKMVNEARIMRALYYYILTNVFNGVPYYKYMVESQETLAKIRQLPRTDANDIRADLYEDLQTAVAFYEDLPEYKVRGSEVSEQRAGYSLALMLMAKFAMWYEDWDAALEPLKKLEALYGELTEGNYPLEDTKWSIKNTAESIFEIQHQWSETGVQFHSTIAPSMYPKLDSQGGGWYDGVYIPEIGTTVTKYNNLTCTAHYAIYYSKKSTTKAEDTSRANAIMNPLPLTFTDYNETTGRYNTEIDVQAFKTGKRSDDGKTIDRRCFIALGYGRYDAEPDTAATFKAVLSYGKPYCGPKFWCPGMVTNHDDNNYKIFRYADAVLMMAECYIRKGSAEMTNAFKYLNYTRIRAGIAPLSGLLGEEEMMLELQNERARELGGEMHRKFDLVRWGIWYSQTKLYNTTNTILQQNIRPCHRYYPIPDTECALSGYVLKNEEYQEI